MEGFPWEDFREKVLNVREEEVQTSRHQNIIDEVPPDCRLSGTLPGRRQPQHRFPTRCLSQTRLRLHPPAGLFDIIILLIEGNDLYNFTEPSLTPARKVADDIVELANFLCKQNKIERRQWPLNLIKETVLCKKYSKEFNSRGNLKKYECLTNDCRCICSTW